MRKTKLKGIVARAIKGCALQLRLMQLMTKLRSANYIFACHMVPRWDAEAFERTVQFLARELNVVSLNDFLAQIAAPKSRRAMGLATLTFDDGFLNHYEVVYPILQRLGFPATFFVCAGLLDNGAPVWTWEIGARIEHLQLSQRQALFHGMKQWAGKEIVNWMKTIPIHERERLQNDIIACTPEFRFNSIENDLYTPMTWDHLAALDPSFITVGSHTLTHIDLPQATDSRLECELLEGRRRLEDKIRRPVNHFCYPDGLYDQRSLKAVSAHYESAVTMKPGANRPGDSQFELKRIHIDYNVSQLAWEIAASTLR
jgi:peptidoglycan/xylan/chitin deacetylase (PgdA/CDA1 family)